jgi:hypothetical protein
MMFHTELTPERWFSFSVFFQLANVGADIERAIYWKKNNNPEYSIKAYYRAHELLSLTIVDPKNRGPRLKELCRVREFLNDHFAFDNSYGTTDEEWQRYFYDFAYAAALERQQKREALKKEQS